jgi:hypothetical protein
MGWIQFLFKENTQGVYLEYTFIDWGPTGSTCPSGRSSYASGSEVDCYMNTVATSVPSQPLSNLPLLELTGEVSGDSSSAILSTPDGVLSAVASVVFGDALAQNWDEVEFNVFGDDNGNEVSVNSGTTFVVQTSVENGTTAAPTTLPPGGGTTGETNNLTLATPACAYGGATPKIQFMETNATGATVSCGAEGIESVLYYPTAVSFSGTSSSGIQYHTVTLANMTPSTLTVDSISFQRPLFLLSPAPIGARLLGKAATSQWGLTLRAAATTRASAAP